MGICEIGYVGIVCANCESEYSSSGDDFECKLCPCKESQCYKDRICVDVHCDSSCLACLLYIQFRWSF